MGKPLIIVESPAKARSMSRYLGNDFVALASYGHVRDLPRKENAVDPEQDFEMRYEVIEGSRKHVDSIARAMKKADALYLATDPDREGEAISWHLYELLKERNLIKDKPVYRVEFHEITREAIRHAVQNPRALSHNLIDAYQARRALDRLVGFNLSPLLWKKIRAGLSAGRVQSPALRLICERDEEIARFVPQEYWTIEADCVAEGAEFVSKLRRFEGEKLAKFSITDSTRAAEVERRLTEAADGRLRVESVARRETRDSPKPPFTTSTLQQEASRKLGFSTRRTMQTAQQLYEGIDTGSGSAGLITYMRTDSVVLANVAVAEIRGLIAKRFGANMVPAGPNTFRNRSKNAQEAHEAIRPTSVERIPESLRGALSDDQYRLYDLIWKRTMACQMIPAIIDTVTVDLSAGDAGVFRATGRTVRVPGYMSVYKEGRDDRKDKTDKDIVLPPMREGDAVALKQVRPEQHFTEPPPRYNEASLVKTLEEYGIGRPSTWTSIIGTLLKQEYVTLEKRRFEATDLGKIVNHFLSRHFTQYVDYEFTARMEDALDEISRGEKQWVPLMRDFWGSFEKQIEEKTETVSRQDAIQARVLGEDPKTGKPVSVRLGRYGPYAQIGTREDDEKPSFASLRPEQKLDVISLQEALDLFRLPRGMGETPEGEPLTVAIGRFGPYVRYGDKFVSLGKDHDPLTVDRETVLQLVSEKKQADANRIILNFEEAGVQVLNGRYGPYITNGSVNARVPKDVVEPKTLTLEDCEELLKEGKPARGRKKAARKKAAARKVAKKKTGKKKSGKKKAASTRAAK
ncbi:MAG: DNA topoisomerase I [Gammaproteobacteria bacterium]|nr:DNA topoisomerase I [Gammaproteobacteria bacterium]